MTQGDLVEIRAAADRALVGSKVTAQRITVFGREPCCNLAINPRRRPADRHVHEDHRFKGETFPDSSEAIESGVRFPRMSSQTIKWRSYADFKDMKDWFDCTVNANEAPTITWDHKRE